MYVGVLREVKCYLWCVCESVSGWGGVWNRLRKADCPPQWQRASSNVEGLKKNKDVGKAGSALSSWLSWNTGALRLGRTSPVLLVLTLWAQTGKYNCVSSLEMESLCLHNCKSQFLMKHFFLCRLTDWNPISSIPLNPVM